MGNLLNFKQMFKATCLVATATIASAEMSEEEGKRAVQFLNGFLGDDVQLSLENAKTMGLDNCIREGANASQNASNTLSCVVSAINDWSGARDGTCRNQMRSKDT